jgi:hypothetical protein
VDYKIQLPHPAIDMNLLPEAQENPDEQTTLNKVFTKALALWECLNKQRSTLEIGWDQARDQYNMAEDLALDENRSKSVALREKRRPLSEMEPERASLVLPLCYEAERMMEANLYRVMRGYGDQYCEFAGREKNDRRGAEAAEEFLNYQFHYEMPTPHIVADFINFALVEGTGIIAQTWDPKLNQRVMEAVNPRLIWVESVPYMERARVAAWRRYIPFGEIKRLVQMGSLVASPADLETAGRSGDQSVPSYVDALPSIFKAGTGQGQLDDYRLCTLDIIMESYPKRWVYVLNKVLVVAVTPWLLPEDAALGMPAGKLPFTLYSPNRQPGNIWGDSFIARMAPSQDMAASIFALLSANVQNNALGIPVTNNPDLSGKPMRSGFWHYSPDPAGVQMLQFPDMAGNLIQVVEYIRNKIIDQISGVTQTLRGQAGGANATATATRDLLNQASTRLSEMEDLGIFAMQDIFGKALLLNQKYLAPTEVMRVTGNDAVWRPGMDENDTKPMSGQSLVGVVGKDFIPAGLPIQGGKHRAIFEALNDAAVVVQTGGNAQPLMKRYIKTKYGKLIDVDEMYPQNGIGNDPMQENANIKMGMPVSLDPDDNDVWHAQVHQMMPQDQEFLLLCQQNPRLWMQANAHLAEHMARMQAKAAEMGGAMPGMGLGAGSGTSGSGKSTPQARPKSTGELQAQMMEPQQ